MAIIRIKDHKTPYIFDQFGYLGPKRRKLFDESWAGIFCKYVLTELPVGHLAKIIPSKELYAIMGALLIQQMFDLTDVETVHHFSFDLSWYYALDITDYSDDSSYLSLKTLWTMRDHKGRYLRYSHKDIRLLRRRKHEQSTEFQDEYRYRAGIEATNSELNRRTGIKKLIYRGLAKVDYCVKLKAAALNILRVAAYCRRRGGQQSFADRPLAKISVSVTFKELICNWFGHLWPKISFHVLCDNYLGRQIEFSGCQYRLIYYDVIKYGLKHHRNIYETIQAKDPVYAELAMQEHLGFVIREFKKHFK